MVKFLVFTIFSMCSVGFSAPSTTRHINNGAAKIALPNTSGTMATNNNALTFTNKVLTAPIVNGGTIASAQLSSVFATLGTLNGTSLLSGTISGGAQTLLSVSSSTIGTSIINTSTLNSPIVSLGTLSGSTLSSGTLTAAQASLINITSGTASLNKIRSNHIEFTKQASSPNTPGTGTLSLYVKDDNKAYLTDSTGTDISLGSGGDASNILSNASFSSGTTGHLLPAGTAFIETGFVVPPDTQSLRFSLSSTSGTILSQVIQPTGSLGGLNLESSLYVATTVGSLEVCAIQGTVSVQCNDVPTSGKWSYVPANMAGPSSGSVGYALRTKNAVAVTGTVYTARAYTGTARNLAEVSQAQQYGKVSTPGTTNCGWTNAAPTTSFASFSADSDCPTATASGYASAPSTKIPAITFASLPPGKYYFVARLSGDYFAIDGASETDIGGAFRFTDGTNNFGGLNLRCIQASFCSASEFSGEIEYTTPQSNVTIQIQGREALAAVTNLYINNGVTAVPATFEISVYRYPTQNEIVARADTVGWYVDANLDGANPDMGTSAISAYTEITDSSLTLKPNSGSAATGITCSSTNEAATPSTSNTTCSAGSESVGLNFVIPKAGTYQVCGFFTHYADVTASSTMSVNFQLIETPTNSQTLTKEGGTRQNSFFGGLGISGNPVVSCSLFNWQTSGTKAVRLMREQTAAGTVNNNLLLADAGALQGQRDIRFTVYPITNASNAPLYVGSVTSNSSGMERSERLQFDGGTYQSNCTSTPCRIQNQSGSWVSSVARNSTGNYTVNIAAGIFSGDPTCTCNGNRGGGGFSACQVTAYGSTSVNLLFNDAAGSPTDSYAQFRCQGPR